MEHAGAYLPGASGVARPLTAEEDPQWEDKVYAHMFRIAELDNGLFGDLDKTDGYNCPKCKNRGHFLRVIRNSAGMLTHAYKDCECMETRKTYQRNRMSGLPEGYDFDTYMLSEDWQKEAYAAVRDYCNSNPWLTGAWLYICGQVGSGKSHLATAAARDIMYFKDVVYMNWVRTSQQMKALVNDEVEYGALLYKFTEAPVLFIDDFFKSRFPTDADVKLAYAILNARYERKLPIIFTSEWFIDEIHTTDPAIASRIKERTQGKYEVAITRDENRDMRFKK